jgi:hypothetical protein
MALYSLGRSLDGELILSVWKHAASDAASAIWAAAGDQQAPHSEV